MRYVVVTCYVIASSGVTVYFPISFIAGNFSTTSVSFLLLEIKRKQNSSPKTKGNKVLVFKASGLCGIGVQTVHSTEVQRQCFLLFLNSKGILITRTHH